MADGPGGRIDREIRRQGLTTDELDLVERLVEDGRDAWGRLTAAAGQRGPALYAVYRRILLERDGTEVEVHAHERRTWGVR